MNTTLLNWNTKPARKTFPHARDHRRLRLDCRAASASSQDGNRYTAEEKTCQAKLNATLHTRRRRVNVNHVEPAVLPGLLDALEGFECHQNVARQDAGNPENGCKGTTDSESHAAYDNGPYRQSPIRREFLFVHVRPLFGVGSPRSS